MVEIERKRNRYWKDSSWTAPFRIAFKFFMGAGKKSPGHQGPSAPVRGALTHTQVPKFERFYNATYTGDMNSLFERIIHRT